MQIELFYIVILWEMELVLESLSCFFFFSRSSKFEKCYVETNCLITFPWHVMEK